MSTFTEKMKSKFSLLKLNNIVIYWGYLTTITDEQI